MSAPTPAPRLSHELRALLSLSGPLVVAFMGYQTITLVDTFAAGRIGVETLAAVSLGGALYWAITIFPLGVLLGLDPLVSQALGAGDEGAAWTYTRRGLGLAAAMGLIAAPLIYLLGSPGLPWAPAESPVTEQLGGYLLGRLWCVPMMLIHTCARCYLQARERPRPVLVGTLIANALNLPLSLYLGGGDALLVGLGLPAVGLLPRGLGGLGIGLASAVVETVETVFLLWVAARLAAAPPAPRRDGWGELLRVGLPVGGSMLSEGGVFSASTLIVSAWAPVVIGAHSVTMQLASYTFTLSLGVASATSVRVGRAVGAGSWPRARLAALAGLLISVTIMSVTAVAFSTIGAPIARLISQDPAVVALAASLLGVAAVFQLFDGAQVVMAAALRGAGFTRTPFWSALVSHWGVGLPLALLLAFYFDLRAEGLWWGLCGGLCCAALILLSRFYVLSGRAARAAAA